MGLEAAAPRKETCKVRGSHRELKRSPISPPTPTRSFILPVSLRMIEGKVYIHNRFVEIYAQDLFELVATRRPLTFECRAYAELDWNRSPWCQQAA